MTLSFDGSYAWARDAQPTRIRAGPGLARIGSTTFAAGPSLALGLGDV